MNKYGLEQEYRQISQGGSWIMSSTVSVGFSSMWLLDSNKILVNFNCLQAAICIVCTVLKALTKGSGSTFETGPRYF